MPARSLPLIACITLAFVGVSAAAPPLSDQAEDNAASTVDEVTACRTISDNVDRLACFDRTAATLAAARQKRDIVVLDREQVRKTNRSVFGFVLPQLKLFGRDGESAEIKQLDSTVTNFADAGYGRYRISLADGSIWETTAPMRFPPRKADAITIKPGILGAYHATLRGRSTAIKRVR
jgi:hypothetical protein